MLTSVLVLVEVVISCVDGSGQHVGYMVRFIGPTDGSLILRDSPRHDSGSSLKYLV